MSKAYRALTRLRYPTNPRALRENWEWKQVAAGEVADDIPAKSVPWLLAGGRIEEIAGDDSPATDAPESEQEGDE